MTKSSAINKTIPVDNRLAKSVIHRAKRSLGQNFLINAGVLDKVVQAAEIGPEDIVIEVGPGTGNLTKKLAEKAKRVIAVEKDRRLIDELREKFKNSNVEIIEGDVLKFNPSRYSLVANGYKVVANIPYYITSHFLRTVFEKWPTPKLIVLTVQKEVAQRIVAKPPNMNLLALSVQLYSEVKIVSYISKGSFRPIPKVDSAVIRIAPNPKARAKDIIKIMELAKKAFAGKRKQLRNTLPEINLERIGISPETRPEDLDMSDWLKLFASLLS